MPLGPYEGNLKSMSQIDEIRAAVKQARAAGLADTVTLTVSALIARAHETYRDHVALIEPDGRTMTYGELGSAARRLAGGLASIGLTQGDRLLIAAANRSEYLIVDHALFTGGFIRVPLSYRLHAVEIAGVAADSGAKVLVVEPAIAADLRAELDARGLDVRVVSIGGEAPGADHTLVELMNGPEATPAHVESDDLVWLPYTSGTTGEPKGVMVLQRGLMATIRNLMVELPAMDTSDVVLHIGPLSHLSGYLALAYSTRGAAQLMHADFDVTSTLQAIEKHRVTVLPAVPTIISMLLDEAEQGRYDVSSLHTVLYGGSAIAPDRLARAIRCFGSVFIQAYGLTEVPFPLASLSKNAHAFDQDGAPPERLASAGRVTPFIDLRIVDDEGHDVATGDVGEILARGDQLMAGYWNRPDATADIVRQGGYVATGDVGRVVDGYLHIVDRKKDMIVSGGFNVFPSEVENIISAVPGVREVAVIGVPDPRWSEAVTAIVSRESGSDVTEEAIIDACRSTIASYKKPQRVLFVDDLPKTPSGKVLRRALRSQFWEGQERQIGG